MVNPRLFNGFLDSTPFLLVAVPFATLFGVSATEAGFDIAQTMVMTSLVIAGASQFTALALLEEQAPTLVVIATALAVNLRMAMYAAALAPWLGRAPRGMRLLFGYFNIDQTFALATVRFPDEPAWTPLDRGYYFIGGALAIMPWWIVFTWVGARLGGAIPAWAQLDFALPICFLALIGPMLRTVPHVAAAGVSVVGALALAWVPWSLGLILAAVAAMATGAELERRATARARGDTR